MTKAAEIHTAMKGIDPLRVAVLPLAAKKSAMPRHGWQEGAEAVDLAAAKSVLAGLMQSEKPPMAVHVSGPGDPLASAVDTIEFLAFAKSEYPGLVLSVSTNGLALPELLDDLLAAGTASVSLRVHAVDAAVAEDVYAWVRPGKKTMPLSQGVGALLADQALAAKMLAERGVECIVESACIPDVNDTHLPEVARVMAGLGAWGMRLAGCTGPEIREAVAGHLDLLPVLEAREPNVEAQGLDASRPCVAVATTDGIRVDGHLGQAKMLMVYEMSGGQVSFKEARPAPAPGTEDRWGVLAETFSDCRAVLAAHAGDAPRKALAGDGIRLLQAQGGIEGAVKQAFEGSMSKAPSCGGSPC